MGNKLRKCFRFLPWALLLVIGLYLVLGEGWKDVLIGRLQRKSQEVFQNVEGVNEARIFLLMGTKEQATREVFPIRPHDTTVPVCGSITLTGKDLEVFLEHWSVQLTSVYQQGLCHDPAYGFRLYRDGKLETETSLCWQCSTYSVDMAPFLSTWSGFDARGESAKELLNYCDRLLPYARREEAAVKGKNE